MIARRTFLAATVSWATVGPALAAAPPSLRIYKTADCTCCEGWVSAMSRAGFRPNVTASNNIMAVWRTHRVPDALSSCHLGLVGGYVVVGHVPPADVLRLLAERPSAIGLTVPGMPWGSPGMETTEAHEPYNTLLIAKDGKTSVFARHT
jgi:hypothetical protein